MFRALLPPTCRARLRPRPRNLLNTFWTDSVTCLFTISPTVVASVALRSAISVGILPPVRNVSRPTALAPLHKSGWTQRKKLPKKLAIRVFAEDRAGRTKRDRSPEYLGRDPPDLGSTLLMDASLQMSYSRLRRRILYTSPLVNFSEMKHHFCVRRAVLEWDVQPLGGQELYSNVLKFALLDRHIIHVSKLVLKRR